MIETYIGVLTAEQLAETLLDKDMNITQEDLDELGYIKALPEKDKDGNKYITTQPVQFYVHNMNAGKWNLYDKDKLIAFADTDKITIQPGYKWDGCTGIGELYEDKYTLQASILHDLLYEVLSIDGYEAKFSQLQADYWFSKLLEIVSGYKVLPKVYRAALAALGTPYRLISPDNSKLTIQEVD